MANGCGLGTMPVVRRKYMAKNVFDFDAVSIEPTHIKHSVFGNQYILYKHKKVNGVIFSSPMGTGPMSLTFARFDIQKYAYIERSVERGCNLIRWK